MGNDAPVLDADMDETADTDDITGISQSTVQRPDSRLQRMDRHKHYGEFIKARQALVGAAVANVGTASARERLRPTSTTLTNRSQEVGHVTICINDSDSYSAHNSVT